MALSMKNASKYSRLSYDADIENDSDATRTGSTTSLEKIPLPRWDAHNSSSVLKREISFTDTLLVWLRWGTVVGLQIIIVVLLLRPSNKTLTQEPRVVETGSDINGIYKTCKYLLRSTKTAWETI